MYLKESKHCPANRVAFDLPKNPEAFLLPIFLGRSKATLLAGYVTNIAQDEANENSTHGHRTRLLEF